MSVVLDSIFIYLKIFEINFIFICIFKIYIFDLEVLEVRILFVYLLFLYLSIF